MGWNCPECITCKIVGGLDFWNKVDEAEQVLHRQMYEMLDNGAPLVDVAVFFENKYWAMKEANVSKLDPEVVAIKQLLGTLSIAFAHQVYENHGWQHKYSGEWVRKTEGVTHGADDIGRSAG